MSNNHNMNLILGERVRSLRTEKHITREALAEKIDVSTRFLADVEAGKVGVSLSTLINLCHSLDTCSDYLLGISDLSENELKSIEVSSKIKKLDTKYLGELVRIIDAFIDAVKK